MCEDSGYGASVTQPETLKTNAALLWSPGTGTDVWAMLSASVAGDVETVKRLVAKDPSLVRCHHAYRTPIYFAVRENRLEVARFLLDHGADPLGLSVTDTLIEVTRDRGYTAMEQLLAGTYATQYGASSKGEPVAAAIRGRNRDEVRTRLDAAPDLLGAGDERSNQPIHWAVMTRQIDLIDDLLDRGADINARRQDGARPIHLCNGDYTYRGWRDVPADVTTTPDEVLDHLLARGAECDIWTAAHLGDLDRIQKLLEADPSLANRVSDYVTYYLGSGTPLRNAAARGHLDVARVLLAYGADPNQPEEGIAPHGHALYSAAASGHYDVAKLLLEHGAYPNPEVESSADALSMALARADRPMVDLLCSHGAARSVGLLAYYNDLETAAAVFAANPAKADDAVALGYAVEQGHVAFARLMLRYQPALPQQLTVDRYAEDGAKARELADLLFAHGMNPSRADWLGITSVHQFARRGEVEMAAIYVDRGADLQARDEDLCSTPLGWAAKWGQVSMVEFLLGRGARVTLPDDPAWATPLAWASRRGHTKVVERLRQAQRPN
jgi:ankyrin repeat protein